MVEDYRIRRHPVIGGGLSGEVFSRRQFSFVASSLSPLSPPTLSVDPHLDRHFSPPASLSDISSRFHEVETIPSPYRPEFALKTPSSDDRNSHPPTPLYYD